MNYEEVKRFNMNSKISNNNIVIRDSNIELLKIVAILLIIISHVINTLCDENTHISYQDYVLDLSIATTSVKHFVLLLLRYSGVMGNTIFFICSAWFLLSSQKVKKKKWLFMLIEVWFVSIIILAVTYVLRKGDISTEIIFHSFFPTLFANNWYLTCYLLFYPIHPYLNIVIKYLNKQQLFRITVSMFILYCCLGFVHSNWFFPSPIILWITIYFVVAYIKLYLCGFCNNLKYNCILFIMGFAGWIGLAIVTNIMGLHISFMRDKMYHWAVNCNPCLIIMAITLFNITRNIQLRNSLINYISSLSILIYLIHENIILRTYYRPIVINFVYERFGYNHIIFWVLIISVIVLWLSIICSFIYDKTVRKIVTVISDVFYKITREIYIHVESIILKFD